MNHNEPQSIYKYYRVQSLKGTPIGLNMHKAGVLSQLERLVGEWLRTESHPWCKRAQSCKKKGRIHWKLVGL